MAEPYRCRYDGHGTWGEVAADDPREAAEIYALALLDGNPDHGKGTRVEVDGHGFWGVSFDWEPEPFATQEETDD